VAGATVNGSATVTADATDSVGVVRVELYDGATLFGTDTAAPFAATWLPATFDHL
jgi:hypothetical protein